MVLRRRRRKVTTLVQGNYIYLQMSAGHVSASTDRKDEVTEILSDGEKSGFNGLQNINKFAINIGENV